MGRTRQKVSRHPICERTRKARIEAGFKDQIKLANALKIDPKTYNKYETRGPLPHELIIPFCKLVNKSVEWLLTGAGPLVYIDYTEAVAAIQSEIERKLGVGIPDSPPVHPSNS